MQVVGVKGYAELQEALNQVSPKIEANIMRGALRAGAVLIQKEAKAGAPKKTGTLVAGIKVSTANRYGRVSATVKTTGKHAYLAPWLEHGTAAHNIQPKKKKFLSFGGIVMAAVMHPGIKGKPFMRPAMDNKAGPALVAVGEYIKRRLDKEGINSARSVQIEVEE